MKLPDDSQAEFQNMKEEIVKDLIARLMDEHGLTMVEAFDAVYTSRLFEKLSNPKTGLYFQSSGYVYSFLDSELKAGHVEEDKSTVVSTAKSDNIAKSD